MDRIYKNKTSAQEIRILTDVKNNRDMRSLGNVINATQNIGEN